MSKKFHYKTIICNYESSNYGFMDTELLDNKINKSIDEGWKIKNILNSSGGSSYRTNSSVIVVMCKQIKEDR